MMIPLQVRDWAVLPPAGDQDNQADVVATERRQRLPVQQNQREDPGDTSQPGGAPGQVLITGEVVIFTILHNLLT